MNIKSETAAQAIVAFTLPELWDKEAIKGQQDSIRGSIVALDVMIHQNAVQCLMHAEKHGDTSLMRRLLVDILDDKTGYRRQGLIAWMRAYSPMELKSDGTINLSGLANGIKRPFDVLTAAKTPFYLAKKFAEVALKPVYQQTLLSAMNTAIKKYRDAKANTNEDGTPIDADKPFLDLQHAKEVGEFIDDVSGKVVAISSLTDNRKAQREARTTLAQAKADLDASTVSEPAKQTA